jgi:hypothetical protein
MTPEEFVDVLRIQVIDSTANGMLDLLRQPPGQAPWPNVVRRSQWFNALSTHDQGMVSEVVRSAAFMATFGFCCLFDGVRPIDNEGGSLRLFHVAVDVTETWLNDPSVCELHGELRGDGPPP